MVLSALGALRDSVQFLLSASSESVSLVVWGSALLVIGAGTKAFRASSRNYRIKESQIFAAERPSLGESGHCSVGTN
jgi:hypothetical protein